MSFIVDSFRYLSSFAGEQTVCRYRSNVGPDIEVCLINGRYQINAGNVNYSFGPLHDAFRRYFNLDPPDLKPGQPILLLGFGGGSVAVILRKELGFQNPITGVELDEMMIKAGKDHFNIGKLSGITLVHGDALDFIRSCNDKFALIITDIYIDQQVPEQFEQKEFLGHIKRCLLPGGKFVFNKLVGDFKSDEERHRLETLFNQTFIDTMTYRIPVNKKKPNYMLTGTIS